MRLWNRRRWLGSLAGVTAAGIAGGCRSGREAGTGGPREPNLSGGKLALVDFEPRSMLHVKETRVPRSRYPVIDVHTHLSSGPGLGKEGGPRNHSTPEQVLPLMDRKNIRVMVNLTGGSGSVLDQTIDYWQKPHPDRFIVFTEPWYNKASDPNYPKFQATELERAHTAGAKGLKVVKTLGLYLREQITTGPLVKLDDPRFDPMWETAGALKMPVAIHTSDPEAFFLPIDGFNERYEELNAHPSWSFYDHDFPSNQELNEARLRMIRKHPRTQFIVLHVGDSENLAYMSECLDNNPNVHVEFGARIGELGRQPRTARKFFDKYQDRVMFGTDAVPGGTDTPQQVFMDSLYEIYYRFLETEDEYFDYAPSRVPPQGRWKIYGLGLPDQILRKIYNENAARLLGIRV